MSEMVLRNCNGTMVARFPDEAGKLLKENLEKSENFKPVDGGGFETLEDIRLRIFFFGTACYIYFWKGFRIWEEEELVAPTEEVTDGLAV